MDPISLAAQVILRKNMLKNRVKFYNQVLSAVGQFKDKLTNATATAKVNVLKAVIEKFEVTVLMIPRRKTPGNDSDTADLPVIDAAQNGTNVSNQVTVQEESQLFCFYLQQQLTSCFSESLDNEVKDIWPGIKISSSDSNGSKPNSAGGSSSSESKYKRVKF